MLNKENIFKIAQSMNNKVTAVTCPYDAETIEACVKAIEQNISKFIFIGEMEKIKSHIKTEELEKYSIEVVEASSDEDAAVKTMELFNQNRANVLMKGLIDTSLLLKTLLKKEYGLRGEGVLSHVGILTKDNSKTYLLTDAAMNIAPTLEQKVSIIKNAVSLAHSLGIKEPVVANLCAKEKPYDKMPATIDADKLQKMNQDGLITGCVVSGPLQLDNAVDLEACKIKGVSDPAGGKADILMCPNIETGNALAKGLKYLGGYDFAGVLVGAKIPVVLVSRADNSDEKLLSIAIANSF